MISLKSFHWNGLQNDSFQTLHSLMVCLKNSIWNLKWPLLFEHRCPTMALGNLSVRNFHWKLLNDDFAEKFLKKIYVTFEIERQTQ